MVEGDIRLAMADIMPEAMAQAIAVGTMLIGEPAILMEGTNGDNSTTFGMLIIFGNLVLL